MEESMESSNARKTAEAKHAQIESELSELSANLFSTAGEMVANERKARAAVEEALSVSTAERQRLEGAMRALEVRLSENGKAVEILKEERAVREGEVKELRQVVRSIDLASVATGGSGTQRMMNSHVPYKTEYLGFISHLRKLLPTTPNPPLISTVLSLPFLQRLAVEDS
jgi:Rab guanine nucleotide exchange factor SEC2